MRGAYSLSASEAAANNMNLVVGTGATLATLDSHRVAGVQAIVWLGDCYKQADGTMGFRLSDDQIRSTVGAIKGHPAVYAYEVCDEPNNNMGSDAKAKVKARSDLIKSIDPSKPTFTVIGGYGPYGSWAGLVDILGIDPYPARWGTFRLADMQMALDNLRADAARFPRVIGIYQTFADSVAYSPMPSASQVRQQLDMMIGSGLLEGVAAYEWTRGHQWTTDWAKNHADVVETIRSVYGSLAGALPAPPPSPSPTPTGSAAVTQLTLVNADTDTDIGPLNAGDTLNLATLPTRNLNARADVSGSVGSVRFTLDGTVVRTENTAPYAMGGDTAGNYAPWTPSIGSHSVTATPFASGDGSGTSGTALTRSFSVVDQPATPPPSTTVVPGRIAVSSDGNYHDLDDILASSVTLAILAKTGNAAKLVHYDYASHLWATDTAREEKMRVSTVETARMWGGFDLSRFVNARQSSAVAVNQLAAQINASSSASPLWIIVGGPMEVAGRALAASDPAKHQYVRLVSHSSWNDSHSTAGGSESPSHTCCYTWTSMRSAFPAASYHHIVDQNAGLDRAYSESTWMRDSTDAKLRWLWCRGQGTTCPEFSGFAAGAGKTTFDESDAGMAYWLVTGGHQNGKDSVSQGDQNATPEKLRVLFGAPVSSATPSVTRLALVNADTDSDIGTLNAGGTLNLATLPTRNLNVRADVSGSVGSVRFTLDGTVVRTENTAPYAMGGDTSGNYAPWTPSVGSHSVTATPFATSDGSGSPGTALTVPFSVVDQAPVPSPTPTPTPTPTGDATAPTAPPGLVGIRTGKNVSLDWNASTDNVGVTGYRVFRNGTLIGTTTSTSTAYSDRAGWGAHVYVVRAVDAAGNVSGPSSFTVSAR